jgi:hypothetical protein
MPGILQSFKFYTEEQKAYAFILINRKKDLFITEVKFSCPEVKKNQFVNCPPIIQNNSITNLKEMIGEVMYNYIKENSMKVDGNSVKLIQLLGTHLYKSSRKDLSPIGFIDISSYYL